MYLYPFLPNAEPLLGAMVGRPEFAVCRHPGTNLASLCYNISERDSFDSPLRRELRGVLINTDTNEIILRPFHKFFNVGEKAESQLPVVRAMYPKRKQGYCIEHKSDGSMVAATIYQGSLLVATKRALVKDPFYNRAIPVVRAIREDLGEVTVIFERVYKKLGPDHQHLLEYDEDHLVLLAIRDNVTGEYKDIYEWEENSDFNLQVETGYIRLKDFDVFKDFDELMEAQRTRENFEGWVLHVHGKMFKLKTDWYIKRHHLVGNLSERSIAKLVLGENIDDALAYLAQRFAGSPVLDQAELAATKVATDYRLWLATIDAMVEKYAGMEGRELFQILSKSDLFLLNRRSKAQKFDWPAQFFKEFKDRYSCELFYRMEVD